MAGAGMSTIHSCCHRQTNEQPALSEANLSESVSQSHLVSESVSQSPGRRSPGPPPRVKRSAGFQRKHPYRPPLDPL
eukprot:4944552-Pyramimonas_sp.AAC.1